MKPVLFSDRTDRIISKVEIIMEDDIVGCPHLQVNYYDSRGRKGGGVDSGARENFSQEYLLDLVRQTVTIKEV